MTKLTLLISTSLNIAFYFLLANSELINVKCPTVLTNGTPVYPPSAACILKSCDGAYGLYFDGHMKIFRHDASGKQTGAPVWRDNDAQTGRDVQFQSDGNLCIHDGWCAFTNGCPSGKGGQTIQLSSSGQLTIYAADGSIVWLSSSPLSSITQTSFFTSCQYYARTFSSSGDNEQWVFADGVQVGHSADWTQTLVSNIPAGTAVLAIKVYDYGVAGGLVGSSSDGTILTDGSWKCTRTPGASDWTSANYDDSQWPAAATKYVNGQGWWPTRPGISTKAYWIWNLPYETASNNNVNVYCRKYLL